ncbi:predicted protein [Nematostella vectensis]|uniref:UspA domain-containing protein n=1 Tax=Nematostella vectensis TaxID=45351 RepID=A7RUS8_NEMVE|nr:universal stress protein Slr1101 [Nematostella vectensis]EDO44746.1 predicted protein [Nematostella vectensis]|eukprot:XP_001636809.1 predicted protein [Nematostella vectensis]
MSAGEKRRVVIPVDGSQHSERAFNWYRQHVHEPGDEVLIIHTQEQPTIPSSPYAYGGTVLPDEWNKAVDECIVNAKKLIEEYNKKCKEQGMTCRLFKGSGQPGETICQLAKDLSAKHVVMGSRGCGTIRRTLLGSVSDYCVHHSSVPVTVIPPTKKRQEK